MNGHSSGIEVLVVGAGFGRDFLSLYQSHPLVSAVGLCDVSPQALADIGDAWGIEHRYASLDDALATGRWDAVHLLSPVRFHVEQTLAVLASGRACASAVPMATSLDGIHRVLEAEARASAPYMMMETALYAREFRHAMAMRDAGELGRISYLRGAHIQDLDGYAPYWMGYPPMAYATHIVAPWRWHEPVPDRVGAVPTRHPRPAGRPGDAFVLRERALLHRRVRRLRRPRGARVAVGGGGGSGRLRRRSGGWSAARTCGGRSTPHRGAARP